MRKNSFILGFLLLSMLTSCTENKTSYIPTVEGTDSIATSVISSDDTKGDCFSIAFKKTSSGVKTVHVKFNDTAGFDAIFDTGCGGMLISLQEAMSLVKSGTLTPEDNIGSQKASIANGEVVENAVFRIHEVTLVDTEGQAHTVYDVPVSVVENPGADVLIGNIVIDRLAEYSYTIDLKQNVIVFQ